jgi:Fe-S cluster assembly protein SufD
MSKTFQDIVSNFPNTNSEYWKYTDLRKYMPENLPSAAAVKHEDEILIHIPCGQNRGKTVENPVEIMLTGLDNSIHLQNIKIHVEEGANATILETSHSKGEYWKNITRDITLESGATLQIFRIIEESEKAINTGTATVNLGKNADYKDFTITSAANLIRNEITINLNEDGANCEISGINLVNDGNLADSTITANHAAPSCTSSQNFRSILAGKSKGVFQGKAHIYKDAQKSDANQFSKSLLLSNAAEMDSKPELEIYADDVKCSHGSTSGEIDEEALFYMQSRGIPEGEARNFLIKAFLSEVIEDISVDNIKDKIWEITESWLENNIEAEGGIK